MSLVHKILKYFVGYRFSTLHPGPRPPTFTRYSGYYGRARTRIERKLPWWELKLHHNDELLHSLQLSILEASSLDEIWNWYVEVSLWLASDLGLDIWLAESAIWLASVWNPSLVFPHDRVKEYSTPCKRKLLGRKCLCIGSKKLEFAMLDHWSSTESVLNFL